MPSFSIYTKISKKLLSFKQKVIRWKDLLRLYKKHFFKLHSSSTLFKFYWSTTIMNNVYLHWVLAYMTSTHISFCDLSTCNTSTICLFTREGCWRKGGSVHWTNFLQNSLHLWLGSLYAVCMKSMYCRCINELQNMCEVRNT